MSIVASRREAMGAMALAMSGPAAAGLATGGASTTRREMFHSANVPGDVAVTIYMPPVRPASSLPLVLLLHGGNGSDRDLLHFLPSIDKAILDGRLPPMAIATPSAGRSLYMDFRDGSQRWESLIVFDLLPHLRRTLPVSGERQQTFIGGWSMGGLGSLRIAFKHPHIFAGVAALEPAIEPDLSWKDVGLYVKFWRPETVLQPMFGAPIDLDYWAANNPATIAKKEPGRLLNLAIYLDVGDQDMLYLDEGTEFLHRILFDAGIGHEYRLVRGGDHVGPSLLPRMLDALAFVGRQIQPPGWIDDAVLKARAAFDAMKRAAGLPVDHLDPRRPHRSPDGLKDCSGS